MASQKKASRLALGRTRLRPFCFDLRSKASQQKNFASTLRRYLADELRLGLESFVFLDDSPAEAEALRGYLRNHVIGVTEFRLMIWRSVPFDKSPPQNVCPGHRASALLFVLHFRGKLEPDSRPRCDVVQDEVGFSDDPQALPQVLSLPGPQVQRGAFVGPVDPFQAMGRGWSQVQTTRRSSSCCSPGPSVRAFLGCIPRLQTLRHLGDEFFAGHWKAQLGLR